MHLKFIKTMGITLLSAFLIAQSVLLSAQALEPVGRKPIVHLVGYSGKITPVMQTKTKDEQMIKLELFMKYKMTSETKKAIDQAYPNVTAAFEPIIQNVLDQLMSGVSLSDVDQQTVDVEGMLLNAIKEWMKNRIPEGKIEVTALKIKTIFYPKSVIDRKIREVETVLNPIIFMMEKDIKKAEVKLKTLKIATNRKKQNQQIQALKSHLSKLIQEKEQQISALKKQLLDS